MKKLYAIVHDGSFDGDNTFCCPSDRVEFTEGQTLQEVQQAYHIKRLAEEVEDPKKISPEKLREISDCLKEDYTDEIKGAWIITAEGLKIIEGMHDVAGGIGNDSACYMLNRAAKGVASMLATKTLGPRR